jgi:hypothetical protein
MAKKNENPNKLNAASPRGVLVWPKLTEPDHGTEKFPCSHEWGDYKTKLRLDRSKPGVAAYLAKLDKHMELAKELAAAAFAELPSGARKLAPLLRDWMAQDRVGGSLLAGEWRDIGTVDRLRALDEQLLAGTH